MGLIGNPSSVLLTTGEMNPEQFKEFKVGWLRYETLTLKRDGVTPEVAERTAADGFAFLQDSGFKELNAVTLRNRIARRTQSSE